MYRNFLLTSVMYAQCDDMWSKDVCIVWVGA